MLKTFVNLNEAHFVSVPNVPFQTRDQKGVGGEGGDPHKHTNRIIAA